VFRPDESAGTTGPLAMGNITGDGTFVLSTEQAGDGAIVGTHRVVITGLDPAPVGKPVDLEIMAKGDSKKSLPQKEALSSLAKGEGAGQPPVVARGRQWYRLITPERLSNPKTSDLIAKVETGSNTLNIVIDESGNVSITK
jgi:hypothetical protein